jgi:hypothetical protein
MLRHPPSLLLGNTGQLLLREFFRLPTGCVVLRRESQVLLSSRFLQCAPVVFIAALFLILRPLVLLLLLVLPLLLPLSPIVVVVSPGFRVGRKLRARSVVRAPGLLLCRRLCVLLAGFLFFRRCLLLGGMDLLNPLGSIFLGRRHLP